jgi:predicted phosphoribosyltransferase
MSPFSAGPPLFADRRDAGRVLASALADSGEDPGIVFGLARGGVPVAAEIASALGAPMDALAVRKIGHPQHPELALGAVASDGPVFFHALRGVDARARPEMRSLIERKREDAKALDERLHADVAALDPRGGPCTLVDDGLATGATMIAACRWARERGASRVIAAIPVGSDLGIASLRAEADIVVCPNARDDFWAVSLWYRDFPSTDESEVIALLRAAGETTPRGGYDADRP